jgi:hypothetical protein
MRTTIHNARTTDTNVSAPTKQAEGIAAGSSRSAAPAPPKRMDRAFEWLSGLPVWVVVPVMWAVGAALLGSGALALWVVGSLVVQAMAGSL